MRTLTASQQAIIDSPVKSITWLFNVMDKNLNGYYWSTKTVSAIGIGAKWASGVVWDSGIVWTDGGDGTGYAFKITNFDGVRMARPKTGFGIVPPSELTFSVVNKDSTLDPDDFEGGYVKLILMMGDTVAEETEIAIWKFLVKCVSGGYQTLDFVCEDFFQQYIEGEYPSLQYKMSGDAVVWGAGIVWDTGVVWTDGTASAGEIYGLKTHDVFPNTNGVGNLSDWVSIPLPFGTCYVPIRPAYITDGYYYVIGSTTASGVAITYTIAAVRSPRDYSAKDEHVAGAGLTATQSTKTNADGYNFCVFTAALDSAPADGLYGLGDHYYDLPTKFSRSDTASKTDFADVIKYVLLDFGVNALDVKDSTFDTAKTTYTGWGLTCNGAFWHVTTREEALTLLLAHCHSTLTVGEQLELHVLDSTSRKTLTAADILKTRETGRGTFRHTRLTRILADCGRVRYSPTDDSQDTTLDAIVAAKTTKRHVDGENFDLPFIQSATIAKAIARLYFQRKLLKKAEQRFTTKATCLALQPSDFITLTGANYGGSHDLIVDAMTIRRDVSIDFTCTEFSDTIENYST